MIISYLFVCLFLVSDVCNIIFQYWRRGLSRVGDATLLPHKIFTLRLNIQVSIYGVYGVQLLDVFGTRK